VVNLWKNVKDKKSQILKKKLIEITAERAVAIFIKLNK